jgi:hypothetical protein
MMGEDEDGAEQQEHRAGQHRAVILVASFKSNYINQMRFNKIL